LAAGPDGDDIDFAAGSLAAALGAIVAVSIGGAGLVLTVVVPARCHARRRSGQPGPEAVDRDGLFSHNAGVGSV
jgi:hypothetical protein